MMEKNVVSRTDHLDDVESKSVSTEGEAGVSTQDTIAGHESRMVKYSKMLVISVIALVAITMGFITYAFVRGQEKSAYKKHFNEVISVIETATQSRAREIFDNLETLSTVFTSYARAENMTWPFVVIRDFQVHSLVSNQITGAATLTICPLVYDEQRLRWEEFSQDESYGWMSEAHQYDRNVHPALYVDDTGSSTTNYTGKADAHWDQPGVVSPYIWKFDQNSRDAADTTRKYFPEWQTGPAPDYRPFTNLDMLSHPVFQRPIEGMLDRDKPVLTDVTDASFLLRKYDDRFLAENQAEPHSYLLQPVYNSLQIDRTTVAFLSAFLRWGRFFDNVLPEYETGIMLVLFGTCGKSFSYVLNGNRAEFLGNGDLHDREYDSLEYEFDITPFTSLEEINDPTHCYYSARVYPSDQWKARFYSDEPYNYAAAIIGCFLITTLVFAIYDCLVQRRQHVVMDSAVRSNAIVSNLFPDSVKDKLMEEAIKESKNLSSNERLPWNVFGGGNSEMRPGSARKQDTNGCLTSEKLFGSNPLAELFPESTILFADMAGFTAWSSEREPQQVFILLETIYHAFDTIAKRRRVFKVETIGDCYVAVCGVPTPNKNHAVIMAKFASECLSKMNELVKELEATLGVDTALLTLRVGLHSGSVTAGVLRGDKGRFQLFGDTMNVASRMESTGIKGKIQVSSETAKYLVAAGKDWTKPREEQVFAKGKGYIQTYWLQITGKTDSTSSLDQTSSRSLEAEERRARTAGGIEKEKKARLVDQRTLRLVQWNVDVLQQRLQQINTERNSDKKRTYRQKQLSSSNDTNEGLELMLIEEGKDSLPFLRSGTMETGRIVKSTSMDLSPEVLNQLEAFVLEIAQLHEAHAFHNFEHASHVTMSVTKLLKWIANPEEESRRNHVTQLASHPLTQFACALAALVHDTSHPGLPNSVLVERSDPLAIKFNGKSVAEKNSFDVAWKLLQEPKYQELRDCIYTEEEELSFFRSILIQLVLATDIMDEDLGAQRKARWEKAFVGDSMIATIDASCQEDEDSINRKTTVVLELLIQASDVAHTMQHWHVFKKWNQRLFTEQYRAFLDGHLKRDPSESWFRGELGFFDFYIIPLAKKLEACGAFGVSSMECLRYAQANRSEWEAKGEGIVQEYLAAFKKG